MKIPLVTLLMVASFCSGCIFNPWSRAGFSSEEQKAWQTVGLDLTRCERWKNAGFTPDEAIKWESAHWDHHIPRNPFEIAMQWKTKGFAREEAFKWLDARIESPSVAKDWKHVGFEPKEANKWAGKDIALQEAAEWFNAGFKFDDAIEWRKKFSLREALEWRKLTFDSQKSSNWKEKGFNIREAEKWQDFNVESALKWRNVGFEPSEAFQWDIAFFDPTMAKKWKDAGFTPEEASKWQKNEFSAITAKKWKQQGYNTVDAKKEVARWASSTPDQVNYLKQICPQGINDFFHLLQTNPYDTEGKCYSFFGSNLQLLSRNEGLFEIYGKPFHLTFGKNSAPATYYQGLVKGAGIYKYIDLRGSIRIVPSLKTVKVN
jgi:hypothetical protein